MCYLHVEYSCSDVFHMVCIHDKLCRSAEAAGHPSPDTVNLIRMHSTRLSFECTFNSRPSRAATRRLALSAAAAAAAAAHLQLILASGPDDLSEYGEALADPGLKRGLHAAAGHTRESRDLRLDVRERFGLELVDKLLFFITAARASRGRAERRLPRLFDVLLHVLVIAKLVAHCLARLFVVGGALVARLLVKVANGRPAPTTGVVVPADRLLGEIDVSKRHVRVASEFLHNVVPGRSLLASSASPLRRNPTHEQRAPGVDLGLDKRIKRVHGQLRREVEMTLGVYAGIGQHRQKRQRRGGQTHDKSGAGRL